MVVPPEPWLLNAFSAIMLARRSCWRVLLPVSHSTRRCRLEPAKVDCTRRLPTIAITPRVEAAKAVLVSARQAKQRRTCPMMTMTPPHWLPAAFLCHIRSSCERKKIRQRAYLQRLRCSPHLSSHLLLSPLLLHSLRTRRFTRSPFPSAVSVALCWPIDNIASGSAPPDVGPTLEIRRVFLLHPTTFP
jgi:hypothetical protein